MRPPQAAAAVLALCPTRLQPAGSRDPHSCGALRGARPWLQWGEGESGSGGWALGGPFPPASLAPSPASRSEHGCVGCVHGLDVSEWSPRLDAPCSTARSRTCQPPGINRAPSGLRAPSHAHFTSSECCQAPPGRSHSIHPTSTPVPPPPSPQRGQAARQLAGLLLEVSQT